MPKICGIISFRGYSTSEAEVVSMMSSLMSNGTDNHLIWSDSFASFGKQSVSRKKENASTFAPFCKDQHLTIVADALLTNRADLSNLLGISVADSIKLSDSALILNAFKKWGEDCPDQMAGNFAFAIWNANDKSLYCCRDQMGRNPFFYYTDGDRFAFSSEPKAFFALKGFEKKLNVSKLSSFVSTKARALTWHESWYENILPLPAGTCFTVNENGIRTRRYWEPDAFATLPFKSRTDTVEAFRDLLFEVVGSYFKEDSSATALLSGGLDSSAIVGVAAKILQEQNRTLNVFSAVLPDHSRPQFEDERFFIDQFQSIPNVKINYITAPDRGPFDDLEEFFANYDSPLISSRNYLYMEFLKAAHGVGSDMILEGAGGELGPTYHGDGIYAEMFTRFRWKTLWRELKMKRERYGESMQYNFRANILQQIMPEFILNLKHRKTDGESDRVANHPFREEFANKIIRDVLPDSVEEGKVETSRTMLPNHRLNQLEFIQIVREKASGLAAVNFGKEGVELKYPFVDKRIVEFCLAAPYDFKVRDGYNRYLIRASLEGILPPKIQWRTSKTPFSPDYLRRYGSQISRVQDFLAGIGSNDPVREIIDIEKLLTWARIPVAETEPGTFAEKVSFHYLPQGIYLIHFLRKFSEFKPNL